MVDDDQEKVGIFAFGVWIPVCYLIQFVYSKINLLLHRKYNCYQLFGEIKTDRNFIHSWVTNVYMTKEVANKYFIRHFEKDTEVNLSYSIRLLREGKDFKSTPYKSEILTADKIENGGKSFNGLAVTSDFLKKFREEV
jgi:hypothetical protein